ncbi:MAG: 2OG-Fe(II) oxygenase [Deltaproteobacteria bacterium]|nr:2OG-Fe(II) oxygenase [Deltaproteobacteria bacterium]
MAGPALGAGVARMQVALVDDLGVKGPEALAELGFDARAAFLAGIRGFHDCNPSWRRRAVQQRTYRMTVGTGSAKNLRWEPRLGGTMGRSEAGSTFENCEAPLPSSQRIRRRVAGARGHYRAKVRHGVSRILAGSRHTLGVIFHDAR